MEAGILFNSIDAGACGCCHTAADKDLGSSCSERSQVFTAREMEVLRKIREHTERAREVKRFIEGAGDHTESLTLKKSAVDELDRLRAERSLLEHERLAAAEERMRLLGHA